MDPVGLSLDAFEEARIAFDIPSGKKRFWSMQSSRQGLVSAIVEGVIQGTCTSAFTSEITPAPTAVADSTQAAATLGYIDNLRVAYIRRYRAVHISPRKSLPIIERGRDESLPMPAFIATLYQHPSTACTDVEDTGITCRHRQRPDPESAPKVLKVTDRLFFHPVGCEPILASIFTYVEIEATGIDNILIMRIDDQHIDSVRRTA